MTYTLQSLPFGPQPLTTEEAFAQYELVRDAQYQLTINKIFGQCAQFLAVVE